MKNPTAVFIVLLLALTVVASARADDRQASRPADHVVLISVDGLRPEFYLDPTWPAPMLQQMVAGGAHAKTVRGVYPTVTYPSHTTMITGVVPARHGIHYNSPFEPGGQTGRWYWESSLIQVPTVWDAAREAGLKTANVGWPVSVGAPVDLNLPEIWSLDPEVTFIEKLKRETRPPGLFDEIEREATGRLTEDNFTIDHMTRDDRAGGIAAYLLERHRPNLMTVHLLATDHFQHEIGREGWLVRRAVAVVDRAIAQMVEAAERAGILDRTAFIVTGDHGHVDIHTTLAPNVWLAEAGLVEAVAGRGRWRAAFHTTGASAFLHLADPDDRAAVAEVRKVLDAQPPGIRRLFRVQERDELDRLGAAPDAVLALALTPGINASSRAEPPAVRPARGATHGYVPDFPDIYTGFVGYGAGFRPGAVAPRLHLADTAAIIAHLLDLDLETPDGVAPPGLLSPLP